MLSCVFLRACATDMSLRNQIGLERATTQWTGVAVRIYELTDRILYAVAAIVVCTKFVSSVKGS